MRNGKAVNIRYIKIAAFQNVTLFSLLDKYHPFGAKCCHLQGRKPPNSAQRFNLRSNCLDGHKSNVNKINAHDKTLNIKLFPQKISSSMQNLSAFSGSSETWFDAQVIRQRRHQYCKSHSGCSKPRCIHTWWYRRMDYSRGLQPFTHCGPH